jgi:hypothetical protein
MVDIIYIIKKRKSMTWVGGKGGDRGNGGGAAPPGPLLVSLWQKKVSLSKRNK